ncbi:MAG: DegT/DnrJ/EryC1/StrS family aminotransferase [Methylacidiphilales bacterium]|nr:DegT/DnrJ/EryC1/StrS family aminotransferase [Candidatus Methylacidiphilales bacterium]
MIPTADFKRIYAGNKEAFDLAFRRVLDSGWFILGQEVEAFEREFSAYMGGGHTVGVGSGTDAIEIALRSLGVGPGDSVITVSHTAVATIAAIERCGAEPVFADIEPASYTLCPESLERVAGAFVSKKPKAVVAVHLYGQPANMERILEITQKRGLLLVEDCAQAHGAADRSGKAGTFGDAAAFSFYPTKNLGAFGDGGAVFTRDAHRAELFREIRQYGWIERYVSVSRGVNSRLDELQAALLRVRLRDLDADNQRRAEIAARYDDALRGTSIIPPAVSPATLRHVYHQYVVSCARRDALKAHLNANEVATAILYPVPVHLQPAYLHRYACDPAGLPHTEAAAGRILSLPVYPELREGEVAQVTAALKCFSAS